MNLLENIREEAHRFEAFYNLKPEVVLIGYKQDREIEEHIAMLKNFGLTTVDSTFPTRRMVDGMRVFLVDSDDHISFGMNQPSPCG